MRTEPEDSRGSAPAEPPRYRPEVSFPAYAYRGPDQPHPRRDPGGHSYGRPEARPPALEPERWRDSSSYLEGVDLFNFGYYWEAHEAWEGLWRAEDATSPAAGFLKGLIKLAAAGVQFRRGGLAGARRHAGAASRHLAGVRRRTGRSSFAGLDLERLAERAAEAAARSGGPAPGSPAGSGPDRVFDWILAPGGSPAAGGCANDGAGGTQS